jgi:Ca2+-binding RTX toxin-like protein
MFHKRYAERLARWSLAAPFLLASTSIAQAQTSVLATSVDKLEAPSTTPEFFGISALAAHGEWMVVGNPIGDDHFVTVYHLEGSDWIAYQDLFASDDGMLEGAENFGVSVDIEDDVIVVGGYVRNFDGEGNLVPSLGGAYIFRLDGGLWTEEAKLVPTGVSNLEELGYGASVSYSNGIAAVGSVETTWDDGAVFVFADAAGNWTHSQTIYKPVAIPGDTFAHSLAQDNTRLVVGNPYWDGSNDSGTVLVYDYQPAPTDTWVNVAQLLSDGSGDKEEFGVDVDVWGETIVVGSSQEELISGKRGAAYVFARDTSGNWGKQGVLAPSVLSPPVSGPLQFGTSVSIHERIVLVGASNELTGFGAAALFYYGDGSWNIGGRIGNPDSQADHHFGTEVAVSEEGAFVTAPWDNEFGTDAGAAYFADLTYSCYGTQATIIGTDGNDTITGTLGNDIIVGLDGEDTITGLWGIDVICGGSGADELWGGLHDDLVFGESDNDTIYGVDDGDILWGGSGDDVLDGGGATDEIHGGPGADIIICGGGHDEAWGDAGDDDIYGDEGDDTVYGGDGHDWIEGGAGSDTLRGDRGADSLYGEAGPDALDGGSGSDRCDGGTELDTGASCESSVAIP